MTSFEVLHRKASELIAPIGKTIASRAALIDAAEHPDSINDRLFLLEDLLTIMAELGDPSSPPAYQKIAAELEHLTIDFLYKDLPRPPSGYLALSPKPSVPSAQVPTSNDPNTYIKYAYRSADGSNYNPLIPTMGQAGTPYARSVPGSQQTNLRNLPDPGLVFDTLLKRPAKAEGHGEESDGFTPHPGGISSLFFALADLIIHSIFNTNSRNPTINNASSYLDLSVLYGSSDAEVQSVRRKDSQGRPEGTGRLYEDVFADSRLLLMVPATCALLILFSRNHNFVAQRILEINEWGTYRDPATLQAVFENATSDADKKKALTTLQAQDDEIFHRARLVNCGFFMKVILGDYVGAILGLARDGLSWRLDTLEEMRRLSHEFAPRGEGNVVSLEFNLLYRWHATLSRQDKAWTDKMFKETVKKSLGKEIPFDQLTPAQFFAAAGPALRGQGNVQTWTFDGLKRDANGRFSDADIARLLQDSTSYRAGAFRARGIPDVLRVIEILGIEQARGWGACSLNEFRKFIGLKPYKNFKEWNDDDSVAKAAEALYKNIDNLELHVGMQAEQAKAPAPGAGLCPGYTISRAILADAVCLSRGDRFLTVDFTPFNLTTWGFADCQYPTAPDGSYGGMLTKLLFRHFPAYYPARSAYAHFPFLDPKYMQEKMQAKGIADRYIWTRPPIPIGVQTGESVVIDAYEGAVQVLNTHEVWKSGHEAKLGIVVDGLNHCKLPDMTLINRVLQASSDSWPKFLAQTTKQLIQEKTINHVGSSLRYVDIVNDVINILPVRWICESLAGITPTEQLPESKYVEELRDVCCYVFLDWNPANDWELRESSVRFFQEFMRIVKSHLESGSNFVSNTISHLNLARHASSRKPIFLETLHDKRGKMSSDELAAALFCAVVPTAAHWSQSIAHIVNYYLDAPQQQREELVTYVKEGKTQQVMEMVRIALVADPPISGAQRTAARGTVLPGSTKQFEAGESVFVSVIEANENRPKDKAGIVSLGEYGLLSADIFEKITPAVLGEILSLPNLQRGPGASGTFTRFTQHLRGAPEQVYVDAVGGANAFPHFAYCFGTWILTQKNGGVLTSVSSLSKK